jgi:Ni,Fe-hydrogenase III large subunit
MAGVREEAAVRWGANGLAVELADIPLLSPSEFHDVCVHLCLAGARISALCAVPARLGRNLEILAALARDDRGEIGLVRGGVSDAGSIPAVSAALPQAQAFERELFEEHGIRPEGHPWLKALRHHPELVRSGDRGVGSTHPFFQVGGAGIHEVAVGPVHAGIIEPGHFRFQCHGEQVLHLEIHLGYQHRGAEELLLRSSAARRLVVAESIAGDTAVGHALAYCGALESLGGMEPPLLAQTLRGIALELERLANHVGDLGALCNDVGYLPGAAWFGRLRGEFLNLLMEMSGNRFGRGLLVPGGVRFGVPATWERELARRLDSIERDLRATAELTFDSPSVLSRFEETGIVTAGSVVDLGLVGPVARASACARDVRRDHPTGIYRFAHVPMALADGGDVLARALVRWIEVQRSLTFVRDRVASLPEGPLAEAPAPPRSWSVALSMVEGWRGEIAHLAVTGEAGALAAYKVIDPSFHNWLGLAIAMRGNQVSDFPLCNKSFNLSYAGHDL